MNKYIFCLLFYGVLLAPVAALGGDFSLYIGEVAPFTMVDASGRVHGAAVDVVKDILAEVGHPVDDGDIRSISWARAVEDVETKPWTAIFGMARTPQREDKFRWVGPIAHLKLGLVARYDSGIEINGMEDVKKYRIAAIRSSAPVQILTRDYGILEDDLDLVRDDLLQFKMLDAGRVDLITQADTAAPFWLQQLGMNHARFLMVHVIKQLDLYVAFNKSTPASFIARLQTALDTMKQKDETGSSRFDEILKHYMVNGPLKTN